MAKEHVDLITDNLEHLTLKELNEVQDAVDDMIRCEKRRRGMRVHGDEPEYPEQVVASLARVFRPDSPWAMNKLKRMMADAGLDVDYFDKVRRVC